jgi:hypothetical protein
MADDPSCGPGLHSAGLAELRFGALGDNGGPTQTIALGSGSVAIDAGDNAGCRLHRPARPASRGSSTGSTSAPSRGNVAARARFRRPKRDRHTFADAEACVEARTGDRRTSAL